MAFRLKEESEDEGRGIQATILGVSLILRGWNDPEAIALNLDLIYS